MGWNPCLHSDRSSPGNISSSCHLSVKGVWNVLSWTLSVEVKLKKQRGRTKQCSSTQIFKTDSPTCLRCSSNPTLLIQMNGLPSACHKGLHKSLNFYLSIIWAKCVGAGKHLKSCSRTWLKMTDWWLKGHTIKILRLITPDSTMTNVFFVSFSTQAHHISDIHTENIG